VVHLCAFREQSGQAQRGEGAAERMVRASRRRNLH
jgi:hypothetical protein